MCLSPYQRNVKKKVRAKTIDFWIEVAHECFNIGNFNSLMAITTALNLASISRLKKTVISMGRWVFICYP